MEYEDHLSRKLRVALALAVLKDKPSDVPTREYIINMQNLIKSSEQEMGMDIDQISVTSQDFEEDVIEDTILSPVIEGFNHNLNRSKCTADNCQSDRCTKPICDAVICNPVSFGTSAQSNVPLSENMFDSEECSQDMDNYSQISTTQEKNRKEHNTLPISNASQDNTIKLHEQSSPGSIINTTSLACEEADLHFEQSQNYLFLTPTQVNFTEIYSNTHVEETVNLQHANEESDTCNPMVFVPSVAKTSQCHVESRQRSIDTKLSQHQSYARNQPNLYDEVTITPSLVTETLLRSHGSIASAMETENLLSQTQNACIEQLSQAIDSAPLDTGLHNAECVTPATEEMDRGVNFKVLQDLADITNFLNDATADSELKIGSSGLPDSGYRSDSQQTSSQLSIKMAERLDSKSLEQSARTLLEHVCSADGPRHAVTARAAHALSRLADAALARCARPAFLDALLARVDELVESMCAAGGSDEPLKQEETVIRLMLLTESADLAAYAIEKLLDRLEALHGALGADPETPYEVDNVGDVVSQCYTFHLLEMLIGACLSKKSEGGESEGDERGAFSECLNEAPPVPKNLQTSISDIWRQRWDPDYKPIALEEIKTREKSNVLERCGRVLNKFIVDCMERYSLLSFAALECFNRLQS